MPGDTCGKIYSVVYASRPPLIDGRVDSAAWNQAVLMDDLLLHWDGIHAQKTRYRAVYDAGYFYFVFEVTDTNIVIRPDIREEMDVVWEDRVEMFFTPDRRFSRYYCLEIDPLGRALENSGSLGKKIDVSWQCKDCRFKGEIHPGGYVLEGSIPLSTLRDMGVFKEGKRMNAGVYRADFTATADPASPDMKWISWVKSDSPTPNFHIPSSLGCFQFQH